MATTKTVTLTENWQEVIVGACLITVAQVDDPAGVVTELHSAVNAPWILLHVGQSLPAADSFDFHEFTTSANYGGTDAVYCRTIEGTRVVKVSPIVTA